MKKIINILIILSILLLTTACNSSNEEVTVKEGKYVLDQKETEDLMLPYINIVDDDISFMYDPLRSYIPYGTYIIEDDILTMTTNDEKYKYIFKVDGDKLIFQEKGSSNVSLFDNRIVVKVENDAIFKLIEDPIIQ